MTGLSQLAPEPRVAELQGLYGPFTFPEKLLQKIWLRRSFDQSRATTLGGERVTVVHPGRWNLLGGPDFKGARLRFADAAERTGDVELHLSAEDWKAHRHAFDHAYDAVVLHVVLFPPPADHVTHGAKGSIPVLTLLPLLQYDLEEYAAEDAVEILARRPAAQIIEQLGPLTSRELAELLARHARIRWEEKVHFARLRIQRVGWTEACHQTALEILGYRFNRAPMLRVATQFPSPVWRESGLDLGLVYHAGNPGWNVQGVRPANQPRRRLGEYARWLSARPSWFAELELMVGPVVDRLAVPAEDSTAADRRRLALTQLRAHWVDALCGDALDGSRFDTLVCDGFLPLATARTGRDLFALWRVWFAGDLPPIFGTVLRQLAIWDGRSEPAAHGSAQGLLGWLVARERNAAAPDGRGA